MNSPPTWRYRICLRLLSPVLLIHAAIRSLRDGGKRYACERLGFISRDSQARIHIHAASVGEVITVLPLIEKIQAFQPELALLVTTNTPTGAAVLQTRLTGHAKHAYLPIDFSGATQRFFARQSISALWIVETEIWPWLYARANQHNLPITIINARLSHKSEGAVAKFFTATYTRALAGVQVLAKSSEDAQRYIERGANIKNVRAVGNLKTAYTPPIEIPAPLLNQPYMLAASTHDDEELKLAQAWLDLTDKGLLVIAPRHPERGVRIAKGLNTLQIAINPDLPPARLRSQQLQPMPNSRLYIADTLGELNHWYTHASAAFVGGSLIRHGGHNVLEPARTNTLIIVGPHTFNFDEEVATLKAANAIATANSADEVIQLFLLAESDPQWTRSLCDSAKKVINVKSVVLDVYIESLLTIG